MSVRLSYGHQASKQASKLAGLNFRMSISMQYLCLLPPLVSLFKDSFFFFRFFLTLSFSLSSMCISFFLQMPKLNLEQTGKKKSPLLFLAVAQNLCIWTRSVFFFFTVFLVFLFNAFLGNKALTSMKSVAG